MSALLRKLGKPSPIKINPRNNHVQFFGHEERSSELAVDVLLLLLMIHDDIIIRKEAREIDKLILQHTYLHKEDNIEELHKEFSRRKSFYLYLVQLNICDALGRFCTDNNFSDEKYNRLISYAEEYK